MSFYNSASRSVVRSLATAASAIALVACAADIDEASDGDTGAFVELTEQAVSSKGTGVPSTKASAFFGDIAILDSTELAWTDIMTTEIKTSNQKTLFISPSLECGLYTNTTVRSKNGTKDSSTASATVQMQVLVDGKVAMPGVVVYCSRTQQLTATLGGILQSCSDVNGDGTTTSTECEMTDEEISLLLNTMSATTFNFGANVGTGVHSIKVQAKISTSTTTQTGAAQAMATLGKGSVLVTEQRL